MTLPQQKFEFPPSADLSHNPTCYCFNHGEQGGYGQIDQSFPSDYRAAATVRSVSSSSTGWTLLWGDFTTFITPSSSHPKCLRPTKASIETDSSGNAGYTLPSLPGSYKENPSVVLGVFPLLKPGKAIPLSVPCNKMSEWSRVPLKTLNTLGGHRFMEPFLLLLD